MIHKFFVAFIPIFVAIDPIGLVAAFMGFAGSVSREERQRQGVAGLFLPLRILLGLAGRELLNLAPADREASNDFGVVPLGMPLIAGPALLTALLILVDTVGLVFTLLSLLVNLGFVAIALWNADLVARWMGKQGLRGLSKIIALLLAAIAVSLIRRGWQGA